MKTPKVRLYIRVRLSDGRNAFVDPVWNRNRTLRACYALIKEHTEHHHEGFYYLRFLRNGKRVWQRVSQDADVAITALRNVEHDLHAVALGRSALTAIADPQTSASPNLSATGPTAELRASVSLEDAIESYLEEIRRFRSPKSFLKSHGSSRNGCRQGSDTDEECSL